MKTRRTSTQFLLLTWKKYKKSSLVKLKSKRFSCLLWKQSTNIALEGRASLKPTFHHLKLQHYYLSNIAIFQLWTFRIYIDLKMSFLVVILFPTVKIFKHSLHWSFKIFIRIVLAVAQNSKYSLCLREAFLIMRFINAISSTLFWFLSHNLYAVATFVPNVKELFNNVWKGDKSSKRAMSIHNWLNFKNIMSSM